MSEKLATLRIYFSVNLWLGHMDYCSLQVIFVHAANMDRYDCALCKGCIPCHLWTNCKTEEVCEHLLARKFFLAMDEMQHSLLPAWALVPVVTADYCWWVVVDRTALIHPLLTKRIVYRVLWHTSFLFVTSMVLMKSLVLIQGSGIFGMHNVLPHLSSSYSFLARIWARVLFLWQLYLYCGLSTKSFPINDWRFFILF